MRLIVYITPRINLPEMKEALGRLALVSLQE